MKKLRKGLSVSLVICLLMAMLPKVLLANEVTVEDVVSQLEAIDTLQEMQDARKSFKASGTYSDATAENHKLKRAEYEQYLADMRKARAEAAEAYAALSAEEQELIDDELVAKLSNELDTKWNEVSYNVSSSVRDYQYQVVYPAHAYELSNHMVSMNGGVNNEIPQTMMLVDTNKNTGTWTPNGQYSFGTSNYEVVYCCDVENGVEDGTLYQRVNLEDGTYYDAKAAEHIRAIVSQSYPYISLEEMKSDLAKAKFPYAEQLTRSDIIAAVQVAIWNYANGEEKGGANYKYSKTFDLNANTQWGEGVHDYTNELWDWWSVGKRHLTVNEEAGERVNALAKYLVELESEKANTNQIVINQVKIEGANPVQAKGNAYNVAIKVLLNNGGTCAEDDIVITLKTASQTVSQKVELGTDEYHMLIEAKAGETINVAVEGEQTLPKGVYLYEPQPADTDGDGIANVREASQILVGVAEGVTAIEATASVTLDIPETDPVATDLKLQKTDEKGAALTGAGFNLYYIGEDATYNIGTYFVDEKGVLDVEDLLPGNYELVESVVSEGYLEPDKPIAFSIDKEGVLILDDSADAEYIDGVVIVKNYPPSFTPQGSLSIKKVDSVTKETLEGATFTLKGKDFEKTLSTGEDGTVLFSGLADGEYTLTETEAPAGYVKDGTEWPIKIGIGEGEQREWVQEVANTPVGSIEITKTDIDTSETLEGAEFRLLNEEGNVVDTLTTDKNGKVIFKNLPYGDYKLEETKAPEGYVLNQESKIIQIKDNDHIEKYEHTNKAIKGSVEVLKTDESGTPLAGAEFTLTDTEDNVVATKTTDENGVAVFEHLAYGVKYKITETQAPAGYLLSEEATDTFTVSEDGQKEEFTYENKRNNPSLVVEKTADKKQITVGETVTYTIVVTNKGKKALTNVLVKDDIIGLDTVIDQLAANESKTLTGEYVVTSEDIGELENIVTATVKVDGELITQDASVIVKVSSKAEGTADETPKTLEKEGATAADETSTTLEKEGVTTADETSTTLEKEGVTTPDKTSTTLEKEGVTTAGDTPTTLEKVVNWIQNPKTGDTRFNILLILSVFILAGSGLYVYRRKYRG